MSRSLRVLSACAQVTVCVLVTASLARAQSSPVVFQGLTHSAVGRATLHVDTARNTLDVNTFDPLGADGVAVGLRKATAWSARMTATTSTSMPLNISWHAIADGKRISTATMKQMGDNFDLSVLFTGATRPTYSVYVYNGGQLAGSLGSLPPAAHVYIPPSVCDTPEFVPYFTCRFVSKFYNTLNDECVWEFEWAAPQPVRLPNGTTVTGNKLRLMEEVRGAGQYAYLTFDAMVMQSSADLTLLSESVR